MRDWGILYERPSVSLDAVLLAVAVALHMPLLTLHMRAAKGGAKAAVNRLVNIDYIEQKATERRQLKDEAAQAAARKAEEAAKKAARAAEVRAQLLKKAVPLPPVAPKPQAAPEIKSFDPAKIQMELKRQLDQKAQQLKSDKNFLDKPGQLPGAAGAKEIKMGGGVRSIQMGAKLGAAPGAPGGPVLKGKSGGFVVAEKSAPVGIGGGEGDLKMGGGPAIVVPVGMRAKADAGVLSSVASIKDKGPLQSKGGAGLSVPGGGGPSGLALGPGGAGGSIAAAGGARGPAVALPAAPALSSGRSFSEKPVSSESSSGLLKAPGAALPDVGALARRPARAARPLFQITGPLEKRPVVSRTIPEYPEWAKAKGIEATVTLQITVSPDGLVRTNILVLRTSGYPPLDQTAIDALRQWRFSSLPPDQSRDEVGAVTFVFSVR